MAAAAPMMMSGDNWSSEVAHMRRMMKVPTLEISAGKMQADAMAMNMKRSRAMNIANDFNYKVYASYKPYSSYGPYNAAVEEAAAKLAMGMRA
ncbi:hypothetical protein IQ06DRAFT_346569 [Phaeosphaeriaceae sp. SRC1lsM3a]|nr:hypothetical protein IQ06DRAFT_346569 [Stagonospora sp. SRC1lsM3a]